MPVYVWFLLVVIGVFDAREYRIPNYMVVLLFLLGGYSIELSYSQGLLEQLMPHAIGFMFAFSIGLIFYMLNIMAAGDVKLVASLGFILGHTALIGLLYYLAFSCCFIGGMYWVLNRLNFLNASMETQYKSMGIKTFHYFSIKAHQLSSDFKARRNITYMPFAPILIVALAMYQYFQY
jgi:prepilin peptidase CpaA